jgi:hypothetical protein
MEKESARRLKKSLCEPYPCTQEEVDKLFSMCVECMAMLTNLIVTAREHATTCVVCACIYRRLPRTAWALIRSCALLAFTPISRGCEITAVTAVLN